MNWIYAAASFYGECCVTGLGLALFYSARMVVPAVRADTLRVASARFAKLTKHARLRVQ